MRTANSHVALAASCLPLMAGKPGGGGTTATIVTNPLAVQPGAKILVRQKGWYRFSRQDVVNAGWDPGGSSTNLQLWLEGTQQAMLVSGSNGTFGPTDTIEFFGTGLDTPTSDTRVYWLIQGSSAGIRIGAPSSTRGKTAATSFMDTVTFSPKTVYAPGIPTGSADGFYGDAITGTPVSETIAALDFVTSSTATDTLVVTLQGTPLWSHSVSVQLNGHAAGTMVFSNAQALTSTFSVPNSWLVAGANTVTMTSQNGSADVSMLCSISLTYPRLYTAESDTFDGIATGGASVSIGGFSTSSVRAFDVTTAAAPQQVLATISATGGGFSATLTTPSSGNRELLVIGASRILSPAGIVANFTSTLAATTNQVDLVIVADPSMVSSVAPLASLRQQQGLRVMTVDVTDVYDTFNYGEKDPQAIKSFLQYTTTLWSKAPRYVLLLGGASLDPRNYLGYGAKDFVPTKFIATGLTRTASDDWFVDFNNDGLPDMAIGRIPAQSADAATTVIGKIVSYDQASGSWTKNVLMAVDQNDTYHDFENAAASVAALVPTSLTTQKVFAGQIGGSAASSAVVGGFDSGQLVVNYTGHGIQQAFSEWGYFTVGDVPTLTNSAQLPFVVSMACLTGYFQDPTATSLASSLLGAANGGAVAVWASSALTELPGETAVNLQLFRLLFGGTRPAIGDAVAQAKAATTDQDVRKSWILFGDPSMKLAQ